MRFNHEILWNWDWIWTQFLAILLAELAIALGIYLEFCRHETCRFFTVSNIGISTKVELDSRCFKHQDANQKKREVIDTDIWFILIHWPNSQAQLQEDGVFHFNTWDILKHLSFLQISTFAIITTFQCHIHHIHSVIAENKRQQQTTAWYRS